VEATCFRAWLRIDAEAVPLNKESRASSGVGWIKVSQESVEAEVSWLIPGVSEKNPVIGMHIHQGNKSTNGPILVGFCGQDPLPPFSGSCPSKVVATNYVVPGAACDVTGSGSPCAKSDGTATIQEAAQALFSSPDPRNAFYLNVHTHYSFEETDKMALGLIRGQLRTVTCW